MDSRCHPQSIAVVQTRASYLGVEVVVEDYRNFDLSSGHVCGVLVQYPNTDGQINDYTDMIEKAHKNAVHTCICRCRCRHMHVPVPETCVHVHANLPPLVLKAGAPEHLCLLHYIGRYVGVEVGKSTLGVDTCIYVPVSVPEARVDVHANLFSRLGHLSGSAFYIIYIGVPEQALGWLPMYMHV